MTRFVPNKSGILRLFWEMMYCMCFESRRSESMPVAAFAHARSLHGAASGRSIYCGLGRLPGRPRLGVDSHRVKSNESNSEPLNSEMDRPMMSKAIFIVSVFGAAALDDRGALLGAEVHHSDRAPRAGTQLRQNRFHFDIWPMFQSKKTDRILTWQSIRQNDT